VIGDGEERLRRWKRLKREWTSHVVGWRIGCIAARGQWSPFRVVTERTERYDDRRRK
jgi:hypothetical protein